MNPYLKATLASIPLVAALGILLSLGTKSEPIPPEMKLCKIIIPHLYLQSGWQYWDPAETGNIANLKNAGKAEITKLEGQVECTRYGVNQTPVTESSALAMWRKKT